MTVGDEFRTIRLDRGLTQDEVGQTIEVSRNFVHELESNQHELTIHSLNKAYQFLGYIPKLLMIDESTLIGRLFAHRIKNGFTYTTLSKKIGLDKSTLANFERNGNVKKETEIKIFDYLRLNPPE